MLAIAGIILVAVLKGTEAINKAKVERMVADLRGLQGTLLEFQKRTGRYAGDCDNSGVLNNASLPISATLLPTFATPTGAAAVLDNAEANRTMPPIPVMGVATPPNSTCITSDAAGRTAEADINLAWNELRRAGVVDSNRLPRELARHAMGDVFAIGSITDNVVPAQSQMAGLIVVYQKTNFPV